MQLFGIISLLVTVSLFLWWFSLSNSNPGSGDSVQVERSQYIEVLESAEGAAHQLGN